MVPETIVPELTAEAFEEIALLPENRDKRLEFREGRIVEVVSSFPSSNVAALVLTFVTLFVIQHDLGRVTGADGGYVVGNNRYIPDGAYISKARQPKKPHTAYTPLAPDLVIEVLSPTDKNDEIRLKIVNYLRAGTTVWLFDPEDEHVEVYPPGKPPLRLSKNDTLDGGDVLPGFKLPLKDVFRD
ncbi:MAG: Uma2 family endonuclease [Chloroflexota bacterium]|nr:Uma2 family endonuclease [Chloroflexota bacterium]